MKTLTKHAVPSLWWALAIPLAVVLVYGRSVAYEFVNWDDDLLISGNAYVNPPSVSAAVHAWSAPHIGMYIPLTYNLWSLLASLARLFDGTPPVSDLPSWPFHAANVLVHAGNSLWVCVILRRIGLRPLGSAFGALVFALHPIQVEAVCWATGMKDLLSTFLALTSIWAYLKATALWAGPMAGGNGSGSSDMVDAGHHRAGNVGFPAPGSCPSCSTPAHGWFSVALVALFLGTLAKPGIAGVPLIAVMLDLSFVSGWKWPAVRASSGRLVLLIAVVLPSILLTQQAQPSSYEPGISSVLRATVACHALGFYLAKILVPSRFCIEYGLRPEIVILQWQHLTLAILIPALLLLLLLAPSYRRLLCTCGAIVIAGVLPVLGLVPFGFQHYSTVADRYCYLSMLGVAIAMGHLILLAAPRMRVLMVTAVILGLSVLSVRQGHTWRNRISLMTHCTQVNPRSELAFNNLGASIFPMAYPLAHPPSMEKVQTQVPLAVSQQLFDFTVRCFYRSLSLRPNDLLPVKNLVRFYAVSGKPGEALPLAEFIYAHDPGVLKGAEPRHMSPYDIGWLAVMANQPEKARRWFGLTMVQMTGCHAATVMFAQQTLQGQAPSSGGSASLPASQAAPVP